MKRTWLEIKLEDLKNNYNITKKIVGNKKVMAVVKANAYGLGAVKLAKELSKIGVEIFGVACEQEGRELRENGITEEILILGAISHEDYKEAFENNLQVTVTSYSDIEFIEKNNFKNPKIQIKIDTGMGRIGFLDKNIYEFIKENKNNPKFEITGVFSHFSCADMPEEDLYTLEQIKKFEKFSSLDLKYIHIQNSAGIIRFNEKCFGNLVRAGIMLYGFTDLEKNLVPISKLKTVISHLKIVKEDSYISYEKEGKVLAGTMVATVPVGYADGYDRRFSSVGSMYINNIPCKVIGKVCMDATMIEIPKELYDVVEVGTQVDVLGDNPLEEICRAKISPYEYLTGITDRVTRVYI